MRLAILSCLLVVANANAGSSNSLMDVSPNGQQLIVANTDNGTLTVIDLQKRETIREIPCGDHPEGVSWIGTGPMAIVTVYGDDLVLILNTKTGKVVETIPVPDEPYGVVVTNDGKFAYITHDYPGQVTEIDLTSYKLTRSINVGNGCRGIALSHNESMLYVTEFFSANLLAIDRSNGKVVDRWEGHSQDNLARHVVLHPKRAKAYLSHTRSRVTTFDARGSIFPQVSFCDLDKKPGTDRRRSRAMDTFNGVYVVTNPWEAALSPDGEKIYTIYAGTDDMNVSSVIDDDYREMNRDGRAVTIGKHPRAVRVSPDGTEVYVYNTLDYELVVLSPMLDEIAKIKTCQPPHSAEWRRGKELFQTAKQPMGQARWIACSSCHPDGLHDGRVWHNPEGLRRTTNLFGLANTHPLHWSADRDEVQDFEFTIRGKLMQGRGLYGGPIRYAESPKDFTALEHGIADKSKDLDALAIYTNSFPVRLSPHIEKEGKLTPAAERGKRIFNAEKTQCSTCHSGPYYTDSSINKPFKLHDVGTGTGEDEQIGGLYDTPTLLMVYRNSSYLHDGRAKTLHEVFTKHNPDDKHGVTSHLSPNELDDLVAFVKSLPYEHPPETTTNSIKHRVILQPVTPPKPRE